MLHSEDVQRESCCSHRQEQDTHDHCHCSHSEAASWKLYFPPAFSFLLLLLGLIADALAFPCFSQAYFRLFYYLLAYLPVGYPILRDALGEMRHKDFFNEFSLMGLATVGAFVIGEYPEAVGVALFYCIGELFQNHAVNRARGNIKALLDVRPGMARVLREGKYLELSPETVTVGEIIQLRVGEKAPLDAVMLSEASSFNTAALTGESRPLTIRQGERVLAGMLNEGSVVEMQVDRPFADTSLAKILDLLEHAASRKPRTELFIRKFARIYTPVVFALAVLITLLPMIFTEHYVFSEWFYRALVFLVLSCPCALVISIPLGYFGGIGLASRKGILVKGANFLEQLTQVHSIALDKTGTLTQGVFKVQEVEVAGDVHFVDWVATVEAHSNHPVAKAVVEYCTPDPERFRVEDVREIAGQGLTARVNGREVAVGNARLMHSLGVVYDAAIDERVETLVLAASEGVFAGYISIADSEKEDAQEAVEGMRRCGVERIVMLSGDRESIVRQCAQKLGVDEAYGELLPEDKLRHIEALKADGKRLAFVGDGINDAPALAASDLGIAMGGMGSDAAIEIADIVIQSDRPSKIVQAIRIARLTRSVVLQNIVFALSVKFLVLLLGALGLASMWMAVFADVGVALIAILNAVRILYSRASD